MNSCQQQLTIIIPVYNAYESLVLCVDSVLAHTDISETKLIIIDDKSTDSRIAAFLKQVKKAHCEIILLSNEENLGFAATVNRAVERATGDIILLNSDTIVTDGWVEGLCQAAYSDPSVGTVTPMSNNASHCTIPLSQAEDHISIERLGQKLHQISFRERPEIGVGVGFCLYIRRQVWEETGVFDAQAYRKGYGEEVDFCLRSQQLGYRHILCDDVFIYHKGTASFTEKEKNSNLSSSSQILYKKYGTQMEKTLELAENVQNFDWVHNAQLYLSMENGKKNILYLIQADFRPDAQNNIGGTQFHVKDLVMGLKQEYNVFVAARDGDYLRLTAYIGQKQFSFKFYIGRVSAYPIYYHKSFETLYKDILSAFEIDLVHIHHTYSLTLDLYRVTKARKIPLIATLHDFYTICPSIKLLENDERLCIGKTNPEHCQQCLQKLFHINSDINFLEKWRKEHLEVLESCDLLITPSENAKNIFAYYYPSLKEKIRVIEHGYDCPERISAFYSRFSQNEQLRFHIESPQEQIQKGKIWGWCYLENVESSNSRLFLVLSCDEERLVVPVSISVREDLAVVDRRYRYSGFSIHLPPNSLHLGTWTLRMAVQNKETFIISSSCFQFQISHSAKTKLFNVAFIGGLNVAKGSQIAYSMIKQGNKHINWFIFGGIGDRDLAYLQQENLFKTNWYRREDLHDLFELYQIDLVCILPIWPETFCYTLSEAVVCGRPVLVTDLGALADRVKEMKCGWIVPHDATTQEILHQVDKIRLNPEMLEQMTDHVKNLRHKTISQMTGDYQLLYQRFDNVETQNKGHLFDARRIYQGYLLGERIEGKAKIDSQFNAELENHVEELERELQSIRNSTGYKAVLAFRRMKIPFKRQLKVLMFRCYQLLRKWNRV